MHRLGRIAAELAMALMAGETPAQTSILLPTRLVPRATTAAVPAA
jgi:LacI family transcriptional regulator